MAMAFFNAFADPRHAHAVSAGTRPADRVHPLVVAVMREVGIDLASAIPRALTPAATAGAAWLITMGCGDSCPVVQSAQRDDWPFADPADLPIDGVRTIRDEIRDRVATFVRENGWAAAAGFTR